MLIGMEFFRIGEMNNDLLHLNNLLIFTLQIPKGKLGEVKIAFNLHSVKRYSISSLEQHSLLSSSYLT